MNFVVLLGCAIVGSFLMALLGTRRWKVVLLSVIVVSCMRVGETGIDLITAGRMETYLWFAFLSAAAGISAMVAALIGTDIGMAVRKVFFPDDETESQDMPNDMPSKAPEPGGEEEED
jgi:hypothetical protein